MNYPLNCLSISFLDNCHTKLTGCPEFKVNELTFIWTVDLSSKLAVFHLMCKPMSYTATPYLWFQSQRIFTLLHLVGLSVESFTIKSLTPRITKCTQMQNIKPNKHKYTPFALQSFSALQNPFSSLHLSKVGLEQVFRCADLADTLTLVLWLDGMHEKPPANDNRLIIYSDSSLISSAFSNFSPTLEYYIFDIS